jgi:TRAP-type C4-dicarboxylate transport system permease small subunit
MDGFFQMMTSLGIVVVMPVMIVWLRVRASINRENKRSEIIMEALRLNKDIDVQALTKAMSESKRSPLDILNRRLMIGCICTSIGVAFSVLFSYFAYTGIVDIDALRVMALFPCIMLAIGISYFIVYFVTRKQLPKQ